MTATANPADLDLTALTRQRATDPDAIARAWAARCRRDQPIPPDGRLLIIAADHPARGMLSSGQDDTAMASRTDFLQRLTIALNRPGVDGVLGTADVLEDLLLLGLLEDRIVLGSMNRAGLAGAVYELDDRFTGYSTQAISRNGLDGGKMLTRISLDDPACARTLAACGTAVSELSDAGRIALVEPFRSTRTPDGTLHNLLDPDSVITSIHVVAGLGHSSAHTWLKLPVVDDMARVLDATTLPVLLLGGPAHDITDTLPGWSGALEHPGVLGLVVGRTLLYPADGDVASAVDRAVRLVHRPCGDFDLDHPTAPEGER